MLLETDPANGAPIESAGRPFLPHPVLAQPRSTEERRTVPPDGSLVRWTVLREHRRPPRVAPGDLPVDSMAALDGRRPEGPSLTPVQERTTADQRADPRDRRIRQTWLLFAVAFALFAIVLAVLRLADGLDGWDLVLAGLLALVGTAAGVHWSAVRAREREMRDELAGFARILHGLSRSVSPDAIVGAIARELGGVTGADHVVVVSQPPDSAFVEATLVSMRAGVADVTTVLTGVDLADDPDWTVIRDDGLLLDDRRRSDARPETAATPGGPAASGTAGAAARRAGSSPTADSAPSVRGAQVLAARVRSAFGLARTISAPVHANGRIVGALVLSRRGRDAWPASTERLLEAAAAEASAALSRAYSFRQAQARATTDALTGLPNRAYFDELCALLEQRHGGDDRLGILMIDIDHFKALNDRHGHAVGDEVLRDVAAAIVGAVRDVDVPARFGGEEFVVLLREPDRAVATEVGERIRSAVGALDLRDHGVRGVSVSVGVAVGDVADEPIASTVAAADRALYRAKRQGRDRVVAA